MATTTNYSWSTPDDTALVKDGAAAIRTLGSSIDTTTKALNPSTTLGDIEYRSATANTNTRLAIGTSGQILTVSAGVPVWADPAGGGKVLQVVSFVGTSTYSTNSTSFANTTLEATITPSSASSKVLVIIGTRIIGPSAGVNNQINVILRRNSTNLTTEGYRGYEANGSPRMYGQWAVTYLDSPATTSATTYRMAIAAVNTNGTCSAGGEDSSTITLLEIGA